MLENHWAYNDHGTLGTITQGTLSSPSDTLLDPAIIQGLDALVAGTIYARVTDPDPWRDSLRAFPFRCCRTLHDRPAGRSESYKTLC